MPKSGRYMYVDAQWDFGPSTCQLFYYILVCLALSSLLCGNCSSTTLLIHIANPVQHTIMRSFGFFQLSIGYSIHMGFCKRTWRSWLSESSSVFFIGSWAHEGSKLPNEYSTRRQLITKTIIMQDLWPEYVEKICTIGISPRQLSYGWRVKSPS
jgi:hypothetical protein